jgi:hypothetical protein
MTIRPRMSPVEASARILLSCLVTRDGSHPTPPCMSSIWCSLCRFRRRCGELTLKCNERGFGCGLEEPLVLYDLLNMVGG